MNNKNLWFILYLGLFFFKAFDTLKINIGFEIRLCQIYLLVLFFLVVLHDLRYKIFNIKLYLFFLLSGVLLSLISLTSYYEKIGEFKFIIKYIIIFPSAFYVGYKATYFLKINDLIKISEICILTVGSLAIFLYFHPIPILIHDRGALTGFQGTFWESSGLSIYIATFFLISIILRMYQNNVTKTSILVFLFSLTVIIFTKTKIVYIALITILVTSVIYKVFYYNKIYNFLSEKEKSFFSKINIRKILFLLFLFVSILSVYNYVDTFISLEIIQNKIENERGKALKETINLLEKSNWLGMYGFGFVESYFSTFYRDSIIGLGEGVSAIFNSFLDIWISVGIYGVIFQIIILKLSFSSKHFLTITLPLFLFIIGLTGPIFIGFSYYLFLGLSYGFKKNIIEK